ncbi:MAG: right-handed parallel beta-helix repeat-containing protein [Thermoguttaceae bacterium]
MLTGNHVLPLKILLLSCLFVGLSLEGPARGGEGLAAGIYYVAPNGSDTAGDGSRAKPWQTIRCATDKIPDGGGTIILGDGLYEQTQSVGRRFSKACTVRAENPYRARLRGPAGQNRVLYCYGASHVTFRGLEMSGSGGTRGEYLVHVGAKSDHMSFDDCIIHDCYNNDLVKVNDLAQRVVFRNCVFFNQTDHGGDQHLDINTVTDITVEDSILLNDYSGSGRRSVNQSQGFVVVKNSGSTPNVTRRIAFRRNIFLAWDGKPDQAFLLLGEDGKPFFEAQEVMIENNLFIHNSPVRSWGTLLLKGGLRDVTFRANTVVGHPVVKWSGAFAAVCLRIDENPPMGEICFANNIWCDPSGGMPRFTMSDAKVFAPGSRQTMRNNIYWNGGKTIPSEARDVLVPDRDPKKCLGDPRLANPDEGVTLPRWQPAEGRFLSGRKTIRSEFERLARRYAALGEGSPALTAAEEAYMPADDILGNPRGRRPDIGCFQSTAGKGRVGRGAPTRSVGPRAPPQELTQ